MGTAVSRHIVTTVIQLFSNSSHEVRCRSESFIYWQFQDTGVIPDTARIHQLNREALRAGLQPWDHIARTGESDIERVKWDELWLVSRHLTCIFLNFSNHSLLLWSCAQRSVRCPYSNFDWCGKRWKLLWIKSNQIKTNEPINSIWKQLTQLNQIKAKETK